MWGRWMGGRHTTGLPQALPCLPPVESLLVCILGHASWFGVMLIKISRRKISHEFDMRGWVAEATSGPGKSLMCFSRWGERPLSPLEPSGALSGSLHP